MKITYSTPNKKYPYLAVWIGPGIINSPVSLDNFSVNDVVIINIQSRPNSDNIVFVQPLDASKEGYVTMHEHEYAPLLSGTEITLIQE